MKKTFMKTFSLLLTCCLICILMPSNSLAASNITEGTYRIRTALDTNKVLDVYGAKCENGTNIQIYTFNGSPNQLFDIYHVSSSWFKIIDHCSGKAIDVTGGVKGSGVNVQLYEYNGTDAQLWSFISTGDGYYYIKNKLGYYLDVNGANTKDETNVQVYSKNKSLAQKWKLTLTVDEECIISSAIDYNYVLDIYNGNSSNGTNIQIYTYNQGKNQKYCIVHKGGGWYAILNAATRKAIDVTGGVKGSGINVQLYDINYSDAQLWKFEDAGQGCYYIKNKLGYYLDVNGGNAKNETNVQVYSKNSSLAQKWRIERLGVIDPYKKSTDYKTKTVSLDFNSIDSWRNAYDTAQKTITFGGNLVTPVSGETYYTGNIIVGLKVLEMKSIQTKISFNTPGKYDTVTVRLPSKIQFKIHKHSFESGYGKVWYYSGDSITFVQQCGCGYRGESVWEIPLPEEYLQAKGNSSFAPVFKTLWKPRFYN